MELWFDFAYLIATDEYFRSGFSAGVVLCIAAAIIWRLLFALNVQWNKIRQFFEPTKKPGKMPVELGPSPASMSLGCMGRIFITVFIIGVMILLVWNGFPES
jgi:hypothetical protein